MTIMNFVDQLARTVSLPTWPPQRIVSLVPSQTELLADLGLENEVTGITKFCVHPRNWLETKPRVGGTKTLNFEKIATLKPDLIIGNKEENERVQIEQLAERYPVWMSDVATLEDAYDMMRRIGELTGKTTESRYLIESIKTSFDINRPPSTADREPSTVNRLPSTVYRPPSAAYFIWRKPWMVAGGDTFIGEMLRVAGFENVFAQKSRYPEITLEALAAAQPEVILLSSEPYPFAEKHYAAFREVCPEARVLRVDGEMFSWYGSRLLHSAAYFRELYRRLQSPMPFGS